MNRWFFALFLFLPFVSPAQDITSLLNQGARLEASFKEEEALPIYQEVLHLQPRNVTALCRCSDLCCRIGNRQQDKTKKIALFKAGKAYADAAYRVDPANSEVNIVMAFSLARMALIDNAREKVAAAGDIKRFAEAAIKYDPANFKGYHILGRWNYEVSDLNVVERTLARWFFGALPEASLHESIAYYEKSMALRPDFMLNYLELAKACHRDGQNARAIRLLQHLATLSDEMYDDRRVRAEGKKLLADWQ
ncbi:MAG TPA: hypothetical protein VGM30_19015 [Puia sp.]|jgi:tetratricopeptide (TPR) repeat protein